MDLALKIVNNCFITNLPLSLPVEGLLKSVDILQSYLQWYPFLDHDIVRVIPLLENVSHECIYCLPS